MKSTKQIKSKPKKKTTEALGMFATANPDMYKDANPETRQIKEGVYVKYTLHPDSAALLYNWMKKVGIQNPVSKNDLHCSIISTPENVEYEILQKRIVIDFRTYKIANLGDATVLTFNAPPIKQRFDYALSLGATTKYPQFIQHITLSYTVQPTENIPIPNFPITLDHEEKEVQSEENIQILKFNQFKQIIEQSKPNQSFMSELKGILNKIGYRFRLSNHDSEMQFTKGTQKVSVLPEPKWDQHYGWYQWKSEIGIKGLDSKSLTDFDKNGE